MSNTVQLHATSGQLFFRADGPHGDGDELIVLYRYPAGDCDTFKWPLDTAYRPAEEQRNQIAIAMMDARECGQIAVSVDSVTLPDGTALSFAGVTF